ncbi:hypothetical protein [Actinomadura sp. GTD37]|uniref:hypothetical protein n=1 Tax=Actinomadura sp. GTD37 TaxID=1778030 RepID=UPI0035C134AB
MTFKQVQALPADPGKLRSALKRAIPRDHATAGGTADEVVKNCVVDLLGFVPAPPKARGAADTVIIDPESSLVLSTSTTTPAVRGKVAKVLYLEAGWTDSAPRIPTLP